MVLALAALGLLSGCNSLTPSPASVAVSAGVSGQVMGGQQPVAGATIQLWTVGTVGDGSLATPLFNPAITTTANGNFTFPAFSCTGATEVYLTATGGNPGFTSINPNLSMMTAIGPCSSLNANSFVDINERTTVAAVVALAPFMAGVGEVGSGAGDAAALANAITLAAELVDPASGTTPGQNLPAGYTVDSELINTLADILATCVNSMGGTAGDGTSCGQFFALTTVPGGQPPTDTIGALLNLELNPTLNTTALFNLLSGKQPFEPTLSVPPPDFSIRVQPPFSQLALQLTPLNLTFAATPVGATTVPQVETLYNNSSATISFNSVGLIGENASDFSIINSCLAPLPPTGSCTVQVSFVPTAPGARNAYLAVLSNSPNSPQYVALAGTGTPGSGGSGGGAGGTPAKSFSPSSLTFGATGTSKDTVLTNTGTGPLLLGSFASSSPNFVISSNCPTSLAVLASCTVSVLNLTTPIDNFFHPTTSGTAELTLSSNDPYTQAAVFLEAYNNTNFSLSSIAYPGTVVGTTATQKITALSTFGGLPACPVLSTTGAPFSVSAPTIEATYPSAGTTFNLCSWTVSFEPTTVGDQAGRLLVGTDGTYLPLAGPGIAAPYGPIVLSPAVLAIGQIGYGYITATNTSSNPVRVYNFSSTGWVVHNDYCGTELAANSSCTITVAALNDLPGGYSGQLRMNDSAGTQVAAYNFNILPSLDFGSAQVGTTSGSPWTATLRGANQNSFGTLSAAFTGDFFAPNCSFTGARTCSSMATFTPTATGSRTGLLSLTSVVSDGTTQTTVTGQYSLTGVGTP